MPDTYRPGWGVNLHAMRWHRIDTSKPPPGQVSFCGKGILTLDQVKDNPYWDGTGKLADVLTGRVQTSDCKVCARG